MKCLFRHTGKQETSLVTAIESLLQVFVWLYDHYVMYEYICKYYTIPVINANVLLLNKCTDTSNAEVMG